MLKTGPIVLGQYRPVDSYLHHLDARAKMLPVTVVLVLGLLTESFTFYIGILAALVAALLASGVSARRLLSNFKPVLLLVVITAAYHLVFSGGDSEIIIDVWGLHLRQAAVSKAAFFSLRLLLFIAIAFLVTLTTSPSALADAVARVLSPLRKLKLPVQDLALILFMAIRFIPVLYEEFEAIRNAQMIRGVRFTGSIVNRIRKTLSIIIPVFVAALQRADELAMAIEARGYRTDVERTMYPELRFAASDWFFAAVSTVGIVVLFAVTV
jgi:energy-coupling factor transport system permease protein